MAVVLRDYPWITFDGRHFSAQGYEIDSRCRSEGRTHEVESTGSYYATQGCVEDYKARCGTRFRDEFIPGSAGCLDNEHSSGYGAFLLDIAQLGLSGNSWVRDGLTQEELDVVSDIDYLANSRGNRARLAGRFGEEWTAVRIADMPFLQTLEPKDQQIVRGLSPVADSAARFRAVLSHPLLSGGITDEMTSLIISLGRVVYQRSPDGSRLTDAEIIPRLLALLDGANR